MRVQLVCKRQWSPFSSVTVGKEYDFTFDSAEEDADGFIIDDEGLEHWMRLPSNCLARSASGWKSSDYFAEVVFD